MRRWKVPALQDTHSAALALTAIVPAAHGVGSLCVEEARGINGTTLVIDGGELMR